MLKKFIVVLIISFLVIPLVYAEEKSSEVLAKINGKVVTIKDLKERLKIIPKEVIDYYISVKGRRKLLDDLIEEAILLDEVKKIKLEQTKKAKKELEMSRKQLLITLLLEEIVVDKIKVTDKEIREFYLKNKKYFKKPATIKVSHILLKTKKEAEDVLKILKTSREKDVFEKVAKDKSTCPSAKKGGDLGWVEKGQMIKEFEAIAFKLKKGQISDIVKTKFGFHIVKVYKKKSGEYVTLKEAKKRIEENIKDYKKGKMIIEYNDNLKNKKNIVINEKLLNKIKLKK